MDKKVIRVAITLIAMNLCYFILDYFNIPTNFGLNMSKINWDIATLVISNAIVVGLYLITYFLIDKRNLTNDKNKRDIAKLILLNMYSECKVSIQLLDDEKLRRITASHCDFNKSIYDDLTMQHQINYPFANKDLIINYVHDGIIPSNIFEEFLEIQKLFRQYITARITFFDIDNPPCCNKEDVLCKIKLAESHLKGDNF